MLCTYLQASPSSAASSTLETVSDYNFAPVSDTRLNLQTPQPSRRTIESIHSAQTLPQPIVEQGALHRPLPAVSAPISSLTVLHRKPCGKQNALSANLDFANLNLICSINADDIQNRWLSRYIPIPGLQAKHYPPGVTTFIYRMLKSYATAVIRGRKTPSFIHPLQYTAGPLATCLTLIQMCDRLMPGSEVAVLNILQREMTELSQDRTAYDQITLLAAFQAYLLYSLVLFFVLPAPTSSLEQALTNLQDLASASSRGGLACTARPSWEEWIIAEAKRRTIYTMYLFDSLLSAQENLPTYLGTELRGLSAPMSKYLWDAASREEWDIAYNEHLVEWPEGNLLIDELWPAPDDEAGRDARLQRLERWLEGVDQFGVMLYAVTGCTHNV